jgi:hypothetical protein
MKRLVRYAVIKVVLEVEEGDLSSQQFQDATDDLVDVVAEEVDYKLEMMDESVTVDVDDEEVELSVKVTDTEFLALLFDNPVP